MQRNFHVVPHLFAKIVDVGGSQIDEDIENIQDPGDDINRTISWVQDGFVNSNSDRYDNDRIYGNKDDKVIPYYAPSVLARDNPDEFFVL